MNSRLTIYGALAAALGLGAAVADAQQGDRAARDDDRARQTAESAEESRERGTRAERREERRGESVEERRAELIREADQALAQLRREDEAAADMIDDAYGHAVFLTTKAGLLLTGAGGTGVARVADTGEATFMHLGSAGLGVGVGVENYKLVLLLADERAYEQFVTGQWDGSLSAQAAAGGAGLAAEEPFLGEVSAFRVTDRGVIAQIDATGTRFWVSRRLNDEQTLERVAALDEELDEALRREAEQQVAIGEDDRTIR
ncbi:MAG: hypothetical protein JXB36_14170 [Gammaproteobacteria bacterium]|nr:hypothetical protein [Gammaproteobacteria bacterium]